MTTKYLIKIAYDVHKLFWAYELSSTRYIIEAVYTCLMWSLIPFQLKKQIQYINSYMLKWYFKYAHSYTVCQTSRSLATLWELTLPSSPNLPIIARKTQLSMKNPTTKKKTHVMFGNLCYLWFYYQFTYCVILKQKFDIKFRQQIWWLTQFKYVVNCIRWMG
jgi:hypothetical protein